MAILLFSIISSKTTPINNTLLISNFASPQAFFSLFQNPQRSPPLASVLVFVSIPHVTPGSVLPDRNFDPLRCEALAQVRAFNDAGKFLSAKDLEDLRETRSQDRGGAAV